MRSDSQRREAGTWVPAFFLLQPADIVRSKTCVFQENFNYRDEFEFSSTISRSSPASKRKEQLFGDLLQLSRIGRMVNPAEWVYLGAHVHDALKLISGRLKPDPLRLYDFTLHLARGGFLWPGIEFV